MIRSFFFNLWFYGAILLVGGLGIPLAAINKRNALKVSHLWAAVVVWGLRFIMGTKIEYRGLENLPKGPFMLAGKHLSALDTIVPYIITKNPAFVFKKELFKMPVFGWYLKSAGMIGIDRDGKMAALKSMVAEANECLADGRPIVIFPEGTRQELNAEPDYKSGVAGIYSLLNVPCVPMALNTGVFWPAHGFRHYTGNVIIEILPPIETGLKRQEFMDRLQNAIETKSNELIALSKRQ